MTETLLGGVLSAVILIGILAGCWALQAHQDRMAADRRERRRQHDARMKAAAREWTRTGR